MSQKAGADAQDVVRNARYVLYAYFGGQARPPEALLQP